MLEAVQAPEVIGSTRAERGERIEPVDAIVREDVQPRGSDGDCAVTFGPDEDEADAGVVRERPDETRVGAGYRGP